MPTELPFTENPAANRRLAEDPLALLIGMMLDQQFPMERAFLSPHLLAERLGGDLDAAAIATMDDAALKAAFQEPPALHRFPGSMAGRCRELCRHVADAYDGDAGRIWTGASDAKDLLTRLEALPGFGKTKSRIFIGVIGKRLGAGPPGWEQVAADWPSIADIDSFEKIEALRQHKRAMKAAGKSDGAR